jgi:hypothetical protein
VPCVNASTQFMNYAICLSSPGRVWNQSCWLVHLLAELLSQLHLNPGTLICMVVHKFCFCYQTCDWWPCHCSVRDHHSHTRNITLTLLGWFATTEWQLSAYHHTLTHKNAATSCGIYEVLQNLLCPRN